MTGSGEAVNAVGEAMSNERARLFSADFDDEFAVGTEPGNAALFGRNVLRGPVEGSDDFNGAPTVRLLARRRRSPLKAP